MAHLVPPSDEVALDQGSADPLTTLIEGRLRRGASGWTYPADSRFSSFAFEHLMKGDAGHLHRAHDLAAVPLGSDKRFAGPLLGHVRRMLIRLLEPVLNSQSLWNGANARMITLLLRQLSAQGRSIELLEQQVAELTERLER